MTTRGILFSAPMVKALLSGRKTQTRRLCAWANNPNSPQLTYIVACDEPGWFGDEEGEVQFRTFCAPGDRLYVREAWRVPKAYDHIKPSLIKDRPPVWLDANTLNTCDGDGRPRPGMHMPRWASRLWLEVTDVRVQRLQDCSEDDAIAEGVEPEGGGWKSYETMPDGTPHPHATVPNKAALTSYRELWNTLARKEGQRWDDNPWVTAVSFIVHHGNVDDAA